MTAMFKSRDKNCQDFKVDLWSEFVSRYFFLGPVYPKAYVHLCLCIYLCCSPHLECHPLLSVTEALMVNKTSAFPLHLLSHSSLLRCSLCTSRLSLVLHALREFSYLPQPFNLLGWGSHSTDFSFKEHDRL